MKKNILSLKNKKTMCIKRISIIVSAFLFLILISDNFVYTAESNTKPVYTNNSTYVDWIEESKKLPNSSTGSNKKAKESMKKPTERITVADKRDYKLGHISSRTVKYIPYNGYVVDGPLKAKNIVNSLRNVCSSFGSNINMYPATPEILEDLLKNHYEELHKMGAAPEYNNNTSYFAVGNNNHLYTTHRNAQAAKYNLPSISHNDMNNIAFTLASQLPVLCVSMSK